MAAWRYEISLLMLKKYFTHSLRPLTKYFSTLDDKFRISAQPCNILYITQIFAFMSVFMKHQQLTSSAMAISIHFLLKQAWLILRHNICLQTNQHCLNINFFSFLLTWPRLAASRAIIFVLARNHARNSLDVDINIWFWPLKSYHDLQNKV